MYNPVSECCDSPPFYIRMIAFEIIRHPVGRFANDLKIPDYSINGFIILNEIIEAHAGCVKEDFLSGIPDVFQQVFYFRLDINKIGFNNREVFGFDTATGYQVNLHLQQLFQLFGEVHKCKADGL